MVGTGVWRYPRRRGRGKSARSLALLEAAIAILRQIQPATIRAVCYRLFTIGLIPSMAKNETNRVSRLLTQAREQGFVRWNWIVDESRQPERPNAFTDPQDYIDAVKHSYRKDRWTDQHERIEVWSEKSTIAGILRPVLDTYGVTFRVFHGFASATAVMQAAQESQRSEKPLTAFYCGDHDCSGLFMSEIDLPRRLQEYGGEVTLIRLALTAEDTRSRLPSFATETKRTDARFAWYLKRYGPRCWELDALSPVVLRNRVEEAIVTSLDRDAWERAEVTERAECESLSSILNLWPGAARASSKLRQASEKSERS